MSNEYQRIAMTPRLQSGNRLFQQSAPIRAGVGALAMFWSVVLAIGAGNTTALSGLNQGGHQINSAGLPMSFEANQGQFADDIKFRSRGAGYSVVLRSTEAVLLLGDTKVQKRTENLKKQGAPSKHGGHSEPLVQSSVSAVVRLSMVDANTNAEVAGES